MPPKSLFTSQSSKKEKEMEQTTLPEERVDEQESEEEEEESSAEEEEESSEEDKEKEPKILQTPVAPDKGSDSEPESHDSPSSYKMQPIPKTLVTVGKRKTQEISNGDNPSEINKRNKTEGKKSAADGSSTSGGGGFINRVWSDDDEIALLNGMVDYKNTTSSDFGGAFHDTIKGKLQVDFSKEQLRTKIRRMKKRFLNWCDKGKNGVEPVFSKPYDAMVFELSKKIWGGDDDGKKASGGVVLEKSKKDAIKDEKIEPDEEEVVKNKKNGEEGIMWSEYHFFSSSFDNLVGKFPSLGLSDSGIRHVKEKLSFIGNAKAKELNEKWKQMLLEETGLHYKMLSLMTEQIKLALDQ